MNIGACVGSKFPILGPNAVAIFGSILGFYIGEIIGRIIGLSIAQRWYSLFWLKVI